MASFQHNTELQFGEQDVEYDSRSHDVANDAPLLNTNLTYSTPQNDASEALSYQRSVEQCNSLSFSHSHSFSYSHSIYPTPQYSVDSISSPSDISQLKQWLTKFKIHDIYNKLIKAGYDSIDIFGECDDDDIKQIANDTQLSTSQRLKLKKAIRSLKNGESVHCTTERELERERNEIEHDRRSGSVIITEREKLSMMEMRTCLENVEECTRVIQQKSKDLEHEKRCKESEICKEFSLMFNILHERRMKLMNELHFIYAQKKDLFEQSLIELRQVIETIRASQKECSQLILSQSVINYEDNILFIHDIENEIDDICDACVNKIGPININTKIKVELKTKDIIQIMSVMGDIHEDRECRHEELSYDPQYTKSKSHYQVFADLEEEEEDELKHIELDRERDIDDERQIAMLSLQRQRYPTLRKHIKYKTRKRRKAVLLVSDEWSECGDNLRIAPEIHSASNKITNIAKKRDNNHCYKGSGFGSKVVCRGIHFWKLKVLCSNDYRIALNNFAIGFVAQRYGGDKRNSWFLTHEKSMGIYSDKQVWCNGKKLSSNKGISMENRDIINIALDINNSAFYVQRCKYNENKRDYTVYPHKQIALKRNAIHLNEGYRLGCYLRQKGQSITILDHDVKPFKEWC